MSVVVTFTEDELKHLEAVAKEVSGRRGDRRPNPSYVEGRSKWGGYTQEEADFIAMKGEYAVAKIFGLPLEACDMTQLHITEPNYDYDLILPDGRTAQVKSIKQRKAGTNYPFLFTLESEDASEFVSDIGFLSLIQPDRMQVRVAGWITREQFETRYTVKDLGTGKRAVMPLDQMLAIPDLLAEFKPVQRDPAKSWIEDEDYFRAQCELGRRFEQLVAERLRALGIEDVVCLDDGFRESVEDIHKFTKTSGDLKIKGWPFEVKSRTESFKTPKDWKFWPMFVDTVGSYEQKKVKPVGYIFVSQETGRLMAVSTSTKSSWKRVERFDRKRQIQEMFYCVAEKHVLSEEQLIEKLKAMRTREAA